MQVLITGGAGFIGAHVARALLDRGEAVTIFDNFNAVLYPSSLKQDRIEQMFAKDKRPRLITGDILDGELLQTVFSREKFDRVLHFAALANPGRSIELAEDYTLTNVNGTLNILEMCRRHDVVQVILASTSSVYDDERAPFREDSYPLRPRSPYGASKVAAEAYCTMWHDVHATPITILRFFSVYGPWGRPDMAPMMFADRLLRGETIRVTPDRKRDFTYIDDVVAGVIATLDRKFSYEVINIGRGQPIDLIDFIHALETATSKQAKIVSRKSPPGEMRVTFANISKAKALLAYEPKISVQEGASKLIQWLKEFKGL